MVIGQSRMRNRIVFEVSCPDPEFFSRVGSGSGATAARKVLHYSQ